ncbi:hypothetical protein Tco_0182700, partial [Tanacetum coccineum]
MLQQVSSLQGQLSAALGQIQALQARDQTHADDPEGVDIMLCTHCVITICRQEDPLLLQGLIDATARAAAATAAAATPMTAAVVEQLIEARVSAALANHETLRNSINGHGDG